MSKHITRATLVRIFFLALVLFLLAQNVNFNDFIRHLQPTYFVAIASTLPVILFVIAIMAFRHAKLLSDYKPAYKFVFYAVILSTGFNYILPARTAELLKATYLREKCAVPFSAGASAVLMERLVDILIIGVIGVVSIIFIPDLGSGWKYAGILLTILSLFIILPRSKKVISYFVEKMPWPRIASFLKQLHKEVENKIRLRSLYLNISLGMAAWLVNIASYAIFFNLAVIDGLALPAVLTVFIASAIGIAIPILPGGLGTFEAAIVIALKINGFDFDESLALAITLRLTLILAVAPIALYISITSGTGIRSFFSNVKSAIKKS